MPLPQGEEKTRAVTAMFDAIAPRYDLVNRVMTFRMDVGWRRKTVSSLGLPHRSIVVDLASGTGDLSRELRTRDVEAISVDLSEGMLRADRSGVPRVRADVLRLPLRDGDVDGATCGFALRNFRDLPTFFAELARVVRPGGRVALLEVAHADEPDPAMGSRHLLREGRSVHRRPPLRWRRVPLSPEIRRVPPSADGARRAAPRRRAFPTRTRVALSGGIAQLLTGTRR